MRLENKVALVTGASRGIGRQIALDFAKEGAKIGINFLSRVDSAESLKAEIEALGGQAILLQGDIGEPEPCKAMVEKTIAAFGRIDILVNNAGYNKQYKVWDLPVEEWHNVVKVNLRSQFLMVHYTLPHMLKQKSGRIINLSSNHGEKGAPDGLSHYAATKSAIIGFTKSLARELAPYGILANVVAPGPTYTDILLPLEKGYLKKLESNQPILRFGEVEEVSPAATLLAADPDGNIFCGQVLRPNCGDVI